MKINVGDKIRFSNWSEGHYAIVNKITTAPLRSPPYNLMYAYNIYNEDGTLHYAHPGYVVKDSDLITVTPSKIYPQRKKSL